MRSLRGFREQVRVFVFLRNSSIVRCLNWFRWLVCIEFIEFLLNIKYMLCIVFNTLPLTGRRAREFDGVSILCFSMIISFVNAHTRAKAYMYNIHLPASAYRQFFLVSLKCNGFLWCVVSGSRSKCAHDLKCVIADRLLE